MLQERLASPEGLVTRGYMLRKINIETIELDPGCGPSIRALAFHSNLRLSMKFNCLFVGVMFAAWTAGMNVASAQQPNNSTGVKEAVSVPAQDAASTALSPAEAEVAASAKKLMDAFNQGNSAQVLDMFLPDAELIDEAGTVHVGKEEIGNLVKSFFERYPGVQTASELEAIRLVAGLALVDGSRSMSDKEGKSVSLVRFISVWKKTDAGYKIVSLRDVNEPVPPNPREALEQLSWLVGSWVNQGSDGRVEMDYRWAEDSSFIVGDLSVVSADGRQVMKSFQRIAWDASAGSYRSWTFDSDGGWGEATWMATDQGWVLQSKAVTPQGAIGSATVTIVPENEDRFTLAGSNRFSNGVAEPDYQHTVVRKAPAPSN